MTTTTAKKTAKPVARTTSKAPAKPAPKATAKTAPKEPTKSAKPTKPTPKEQPIASVPTSLREALVARQAVLLKIRSNGTVRSLPYLTPGSEDRKAAEAVAARVTKGESVPAIAEDLKVSLATARRFVTNLALAQAVEAGKHDAAWTPGTKQVVVHTVIAKA